MTESASDGRGVPAIERVEHNVADADPPFATDIETAYAENFEHHGHSARLGLANGNCIEYHRLDAETLVECVFVADERELLLENTHKTRRADVADVDAFLATVSESVTVYRRDVDTVADAETLWHNIVPALEG